MRLRTLVGFTSALIAAVLFNTPNHAEAQAQAPAGIGIMYLTNSDAAGDRIYDWTDSPALTNPFAQGIALRTQWSRVEPHEHANADDFYWDFLDQGVALAAAHGKKVSILVTAGVTTPQWVYDAGAPSFNVTEQYGYSSITDGVTTAGSTTVKSAGNTAAWSTGYSLGLQISGDGIPSGATIVSVNSSNSVTISAPATKSATQVAIVTAQIAPMPLPWDPVFQAKWGAFIKALAARYGSAPNLAYIVMSGPGRRAEAYFCFTPDDVNYFTNTLGGLPNWEKGVKWIIDQYAAAFPNTPFLLDMASPIPTSDGDNSLQAVCDYGVAQYPGNHFGVKSDGLFYPNGPTIGSMGATEVPLLCPTSTVGYQFYVPQKGAVDPVTGRLLLDLGLERAISLGAHFVEVYATDCDNPLAATALTAAGGIMTTTPAIPVPPSALKATATSAATVDLSWTDPSDNEIGQRIERSVGSNSDYSLLADVGPGVTKFTDDHLVDGTEYYYHVLAFNTGGSSSASDEQSAITTLNPPTALSAVSASSSLVKLAWTDNSLSETAYRIERSAVDDQHFAEVATVGPNITAYADSGLDQGTRYYYRVRASNAIATSDYSTEKNASTLSNTPLAPSELKVTSVTSSKIVLAWTDNSDNELHFRIQRKKGATGTYSDIATPGANITTYTDNDSALTDGTTYYYRVSANNSAGDSPFSNEISGITVLAAPTSLKAAAISSSQVNLTWSDNSSSETGFDIERSPGDKSHYTQIATVGTNQTSYSDSGLSEATTYYYRVRAYNAVETSGYSNDRGVSTVFNLPAAPSGLRITALLSNKVSLAWTDNSGNEKGFRIQRKKGAGGSYVEIATPGANVTTYVDNDKALLDGTQYYYKVQAYNTSGNSAFSNEVNGVTALAKPTSATATAKSSSRIDLTWSDNSASETGYKIERKKTVNGAYAQVAQVGANVQSYSDTIGLESGTRYYYRVRATNGTLDSDYSNQPFAVTSK